MAKKNILVAVTGGIAAYKSAELVRLLQQRGHSVRVLMTRGAEAFIQPLTFQALTGEPVRQGLLDPDAEAGMGHIELAKWADLVLVAPASADAMARLAAGLADDLLTTVCLATEAPIVLAPAMNQAMWRNARTQANCARLESDPQFRLWGPASGDQACGDNGPGRMLEPEVIADAVAALDSRPLADVRVVITAGPTREAVDPVRYLTNHSSGKMGYALATTAADAGAVVTLVSGPVSLPTPAGVRRIDVESAAQMQSAVDQALSEGCDWFVAAAAVADYRPEQVAAEKMKKDRDETMVLRMTRNPDILAGVAARAERPLVVGFAAETQDVETYARDKLQRKKLDLIVANDVSDQSIGFNSDSNAVTLIATDGDEQFDVMTKQELAQQLCLRFHERWQSLGRPATDRDPNQTSVTGIQS